MHQVQMHNQSIFDLMVPILFEFCQHRVSVVPLSLLHCADDEISMGGVSLKRHALIDDQFDEWYCNLL